MSTAPTYDAVPYSVSAFRQTDPDRLAVLAHIFGLAAAPPHACRVLELGCASGGNLIPMAQAYPHSHFVGLDLSERQVTDGSAVIAQLQLPNIQLLHLSITDVTPALGQFDYILAHGVYCWVPPPVQEKILDICRDNLTPAGVAYISYNTFPGWGIRSTLREIVCLHTNHLPDPVERVRQSREVLSFYGSFYAAGKTADAALYAQEIELLLKTPDTYILHEYLEDFNQPLYFHQFVARAAEKNLQYLAEAEIASMLPARFGPDTEKNLRAISADFLQLEQNMDFLRNRMFRQSLLCNAAIPLDHMPRPEAITRFHIASLLKPESAAPDVLSDKPEIFAAPERPKLTTRSPLLKAAMLTLAQSWPLPLSFDALLQQSLSRLQAAGPDLRPPETLHVNDLAQGLLNCYTAGVIELSASPPAFTTALTDKPLTTPYIRLRASSGNEVTNLRLENIALTESARLVLAHLDGQHTRAALTTLIEQWLQKSNPRQTAPQNRAAQYIDYILPNFANSALLIASASHP